MSTQVIDPWLEPDGFSSPILYADKYGRDEPDGLEIHPGLDPEVVVVEGGVPKVTSEPEPEPEPEGPEVFQVEDGTVTLEKEKGQWKCTLESGVGGQPQVYWGKNKNELLINAMKAQLNATKKIRDLNGKLKLGGTPAPKPVPIVPPSNRALNADEIFEITTELASNPDKALEKWFQKRTGRSVEQLVSLAEKGANADASLETEAIGKDFMTRHPDYYATMPNFNRLVQWIGKFKLANPSAGINELYLGGVFTVENLEEAFEDLTADGFLAKAPKPVAPPAPEPVPQPRPEERIVRTETRPRAALGLKTNDVSRAPLPEAPKAPSVEDLDNLSDEQIKQLLGGVRRTKMLSRRS